MNIAILGGSGFIGSNLVKKLKDDHKVTVFDNFSRGTEKNLPDDVLWQKVDAKNPIDLKGFDRVYDFAARVAGVRDLYRDPATLLADNLAITSGIMKSVVDSGVKDYFYVSSSCVYDFPGAQVPHVEEDTNICDTSYGFSKVAGEQLVRWYARQYGFTYRLVRLFNVYGPGDSPLSPHVIPEFIRKAQEAKTTGKFSILGSGEQTRDFTWMDDVISGILTVSQKGTPGQPYNIGTNQQTSINTLAKMVCDQMGVYPEFTHEPSAAIEDIQYRAADNTKLRGLGWLPTVTLSQGIAKLCD